MEAYRASGEAGAGALILCTELGEQEVERRPGLLEKALVTVARSGLARRVQQYVTERPDGDDEDRGLALLFELEHARRAVEVAGQRRLPARVRRALDETRREVAVAARAALRSPWAFRRWRDAIAGYCQDHGIDDPEHPFIALLESTGWEVDALVEVWRTRREAVASEKAAIAYEAQARREQARGRLPAALAQLRAALRLAPRRALAVRALEELLAVAGRALEFVVEWDPRATPAAVHAAGMPSGTVALRRVQGPTTLTLAEDDAGKLIAVVEDAGRPVESAVVTLFEVDKQGERRLRSGVTDAAGEAHLGPARPVADLLADRTRSMKVSVALPSAAPEKAG